MPETIIIIREATIKDFDTICDQSETLLKHEYFFDKTINIHWLREKGGEEFLHERMHNQNGVLLVAVQENEIIGYLVGGIVEPEEFRNLPSNAIAELEEFFVLEKCRGLNVGTKLFDAFSTWAKNQGAQKLKVVVSARNDRSINFYKKMLFDEYDLVLEKEIN